MSMKIGGPVVSGKPRALILCESSGVVREAFRAVGWDAWSCDLLPADDGSPHHYQMDVFEALDQHPEGYWDLLGMHPPCTYLSVSGIHWNNRGRGWAKTNAALFFVKKLMRRPEPWYLENPISIISSRIRKPDQIIQPHQFGHDASKKTCLWLHRLPPLVIDPKLAIPPRMVDGKPRWANQTDSGQNKLAPSKDRWKDRSKTYPGIAKAFADNWGNLKGMNGR